MKNIKDSIVVMGSYNKHTLFEIIKLIKNKGYVYMGTWGTIRILTQQIRINEVN